MKNVKQIPKPELKSGRKLTPLEMNAIRCDRQHTPLNREHLDKITSGSDSTSGGNSK